ncbi:MAG TPA: hypothetical protein DDY32_11090 [Desulfobulbaceae bacterium]|nr:hypothetical protein [Desulfobulbaceae bacterium]
MADKKQKRDFFAHIHAPRVSRYALRVDATWGLGVLLCVLFVILTLTGVLLAAVFEPAFASAYDSVWEISDVYPHGRLLRSVHYLAGNGFVIVALLHLLRVVCAGAYAGERYRNYLYGLTLFVAGFGALASGYFLPMTEISYWALVVGLSMDYIPQVGSFLKGLVMGGQTLGDVTMVRLYVLHVVVLPLMMLGVSSLHLWRIRKDQGLLKPKGLSEAELEPVSYKAAVTRELTVFLSACLVLVLAALWFPVELEPRPVPAYPPNPVKAAWFFIALQETLSYSVLWGGLLPIVALVVFFVWGPRFAAPGTGELAPWRRRLFFGTTVGIVVMYAVFTLAGLYCRGPNWTFVSPWKTLKQVISVVNPAPKIVRVENSTDRQIGKGKKERQQNLDILR